MYIMRDKSTEFFQFIVLKGREHNFLTLLEDLKLSMDDVKGIKDEGGAIAYLLDINEKENKNEIRKSLNSAQTNFIN